MKCLSIALLLATFGVLAQPREIVETVTVSGQDRIDLDLGIADQILFKAWDKKEVRLEVSVEINEGEDNDLFELQLSQTASTIYVEIDESIWDKFKKNKKWKTCSYSSKINYRIHVPRDLNVRSNTISGNYEVSFYGVKMDLRTISGAIDVTVPHNIGLDFKAKTISGEVFSDIEINYPEGKDGLRQIVGQNFKGRINEGGVEVEFETISGNIYLRKG